MFILSVVALSFFCTLLITPLVARYAANRRIYDLPGGRRVHTRPVPRLGGVSIFIALLASMVVILPRVLDNENGLGSEDRFFIGTLVGATIIFAAGLRDDLKALRPVVKLIFQIVAAVVVFAFGVRIEVLMLGPTTTIETGWLALPLTVVWIIGVTNAFNLIDGLDGLATGIALVALATIMATAALMARPEVVITTAALMGALAAFLFYNFHPAKIFLGDSGSYLIGFILAALTIQGSFRTGTVTPVVVPTLILGLPLLDVAIAFVRRWLRGVPIFGADAHHIHHRLLAIGLTHQRAVFVMHVAAVILASVGASIVLSPPEAKVAIAIVSGLAALALIAYGIRRLEYHEFQVLLSEIAKNALMVRRKIGYRIHAREVTQMIERSQGVDQMKKVLEQNASRLGVIGIEFGQRGNLYNSDNNRTGAIKIEIPLFSSRSGEDYAIRIWCSRDDEQDYNSAEWLGRSLYPVLEKKLATIEVPAGAAVQEGERDRTTAKIISEEPGSINQVVINGHGTV